MHVRKSVVTRAITCICLTVGVPACSDKNNSDASDAGGASDASADPDAVDSLCYGSAYRCENNVATACEPGSAGMRTDCTAMGLFCNPYRGCSECVPGQTSCANGHATWCRNDGTLAEFECDATQGLTCEPGGCRGPCALNEVQDSYIGCDYYPTVTLNPVWHGFSFAIAVSNTQSQATLVTITRGDTTLKSVSVPGNALSTFELPWVPELKGGDVACTDPPPAGATRLVKQGAYRVRSDRPVTVYQFSPLEYQLGKTIAEIPADCPVIDPVIGQCVPHDQIPANGKCLSYSNDASLLLPATALTGNYTAIAWPSQTDDSGASAGSGFIAITATQDGTQVELHGAGTINPGAGLPAAGNGTVKLDRGDVLELVAGPDSDISGTRVRADKPVQVISGQSCAYVPDAMVGTCDHIEEGMFPEDTLGASYVVTMPVLATSEQEETPTPFILRVSAILPATTIRFEPEVHAPITLDAGEVRDVTLEGAAIHNVLAESEKPFQIATYMVGQEALPGGSILGDPSMSLAIPVEQFRTSYLFTAPTTYDFNYATIVAKRGTKVSIDGKPLADSEFERVGSSTFGVAQYLLDNAKAVHTLKADAEVGLTVYGYGWFTSYMYPGGADLDRITIPPIL
jgi:hypothetical protein